MWENCSDKQDLEVLQQQYKQYGVDYAKRTVKKDPLVDKPKHYTFSQYEVIEVLEAWFPSDPLLWQVGKYISRAGRKGSRAEDLKKARFYLDRAILQAEKGEDL